MRGSTGTRREEDEDENVFISMTDMTVSFLFIVMILLAFFASQFRTEDVVPLSRHIDVVEERDALHAELERLRAALIAAQAELARQRDEIAALLQEISDLRTESDRLADTAARQSDEIARLREELVEARAAQARAEQEIARLTAEVEHLEARIADLETKLVDPLETYLSAVGDQRRRLLNVLRDAIQAEFPDLEVAISSKQDALRFQGEGLFLSASDQIRAVQIPRVERIAEILDDVLPCYTTGPRSEFSENCNPVYALIEAVQIEGHTDDRGSASYNLRLSARRGAETYAVMTRHLPGLIGHRNFEGQPVLSVSGYGKDRPVASNETAEGRAANRRIDLRFIMFSPAQSEQIEEVRQRLADAMGTVEP